MSAGMPAGAFNLPPGVTLADPHINPPDECSHQHEDGADAFTLIAVQIDPDNDGTDRNIFRCDICGEQQERECRE